MSQSTRGHGTELLCLCTNQTMRNAEYTRASSLKVIGLKSLDRRCGGGGETSHVISGHVLMHSKVHQSAGWNFAQWFHPMQPLIKRALNGIENYSGFLKVVRIEFSNRMI